MLSREGPQARMVEMMVEHKQERKGGEYWEVAQVLKQINKPPKTINTKSTRRRGRGENIGKSHRLSPTNNQMQN